MIIKDACSTPDIFHVFRAGEYLAHFNDLERRLAQTFHGIVRRELPEHLERIDRLNSEPSYTGMCATHDFCDTNMLMAEAFERVVGRESDVSAHVDVALWNKAWNVAKLVGFNKEWN